MNADRLLNRFLDYVRVHTTAVEDAQTYPSSLGQWELGKQIVAELQQLGLKDAHQDDHALVHATLPATKNCQSAPAIAFNAHLDTSPETSGENVKPRVIRKYAGGDIPLPGDSGRVITVKENPELNGLHGKTLITTDGSTLLGADDKAGLAVIMELAAHLQEHPEIEHGPVKILFTCDEEIGLGVDHVDVPALGAAACYTLDGAGSGEIDVQTFSADLATVTVRGVNIHPSIAKNRMVNALRGAADFLCRLPHDRLAPEATEKEEGFLHPYVISGGVAEVVIKVLLRDFQTSALTAQADLLKELALSTEQAIPGVKIEVAVKSQYRNMAEGLAKEPRAVALAVQAHENLGRQPRQTIVRGGTDGSQFTARGLPTPNLSTGQHNPHSPLEWACLEEMTSACEVLVELVKLWGKEA